MSRSLVILALTRTAVIVSVELAVTVLMVLMVPYARFYMPLRRHSLIRMTRVSW